MKSIFSYISLTLWLLFGLYFGLAGILYADLTEEKEFIGGSNQVKKEVQLPPGVTKGIDSLGNAYYEMNGVKFTSLEKIKLRGQEEAAESVFNWYKTLPNKLILFITSMALGGLGSLISLVKKLALENARIDDLRTFWHPMLGALIGIIVLGISYLIPIIITTESEVEIRATTLIFLSMFAGMYSKEFLAFLESRFSNYLKQHGKNE
ncbi:hypothetical protein FNH22_26890 [Fulvivirga sp. M361]|uniref:hypothetical protein n=1 Tax=Fulvivirga sp. M361 TaxID=2594266 RepID=UPI00117B3585|nr:hypothetical protein [Fulvivirga sp. M361]TRX49696.1 hypothetical protein FNH22_26890 [Fulvivirga sp. M361]